MTPSEKEIEIRITHLCNRAATGTITLEEENELLCHFALEPSIMRHLVPVEYFSDRLIS